MARKKRSGRVISSRIRTTKNLGRSSPKFLAELAKELHTTTPEKETIPVSDIPESKPPLPIHPSAQSLRVISDRLDSLEQRFDSQHERLNNVHTNFGSMSARVSKLEDRIASLENENSKNRAKDTFTNVVLNFLRSHKGLKFNTGTVAANVDDDSDKTSTTLRMLAMRQGTGVKAEKKEGKSVMYWYEDIPSSSEALAGIE